MTSVLQTDRRGEHHTNTRNKTLVFEKCDKNYTVNTPIPLTDSGNSDKTKKLSSLDENDLNNYMVNRHKYDTDKTIPRQSLNNPNAALSYNFGHYEVIGRLSSIDTPTYEEIPADLMVSKTIPNQYLY